MHFDQFDINPGVRQVDKSQRNIRALESQDTANPLSFPCVHHVERGDATSRGSNIPVAD